MNPSRDRADVVATAVLQIIRQHLLEIWNNLPSDPVLRAQLADLLRDEFSDVAREIASERRTEE